MSALKITVRLPLQPAHIIISTQLSAHHLLLPVSGCSQLRARNGELF
jgi:hypothetical protein